MELAWSLGSRGGSLGKKRGLAQCGTKPGPGRDQQRPEALTTEDLLGRWFEAAVIRTMTLGTRKYGRWTTRRAGIVSPLTLWIEDLFRLIQQDVFDEFYRLSVGFEQSAFHDEANKLVLKDRNLQTTWSCMLGVKISTFLTFLEFILFSTTQKELVRGSKLLTCTFNCTRNYRGQLGLSPLKVRGSVTRQEVAG